MLNRRSRDGGYAERTAAHSDGLEWGDRAGDGEKVPGGVSADETSERSGSSHRLMGRGCSPPPADTNGRANERTTKGVGRQRTHARAPARTHHGVGPRSLGFPGQSGGVWEAGARQRASAIEQEGPSEEEAEPPSDDDETAAPARQGLACGMERNPNEVGPGPPLLPGWWWPRSRKEQGRVGASLVAGLSNSPKGYPSYPCSSPASPTACCRLCNVWKRSRRCARSNGSTDTRPREGKRNEAARAQHRRRGSETRRRTMASGPGGSARSAGPARATRASVPSAVAQVASTPCGCNVQLQRALEGAEAEG